MTTSQQVYNDAKSLLESTKIINLLSTLGTVHIIGSYAANLMWDPDIDLVVITDTPKASAIKAISLLAKTEQFQKLEYGDFKNHPMKNRPLSFIVNARKEWKDQKWEIETWFVSKFGDQIETLEKLKNLSHKDRKTIIEKKQQRALAGNTKQNLSSWKIYQDYI